VDSARGNPAADSPRDGTGGGGTGGGGNSRGGTSGGGNSHGAAARAVTVAAYVALFLLGALIGLIGTFQYNARPAPLLAILFDVAILATCALGSAGMRSAIGGVLPAAGWILVTLVLSTNSAGGSILVTDTAAGKWFLFGGAVSAAAGAVYAFAVWSRPSREHRAGQSSGSHPERRSDRNGSREGSASARASRKPGR
jgi:Family of unknown function (DUF6113)